MAVNNIDIVPTLRAKGRFPRKQLVLVICKGIDLRQNTQIYRIILKYSPKKSDAEKYKRSVRPLEARRIQPRAWSQGDVSPPERPEGQRWKLESLRPQGEGSAGRLRDLQ